MREKSIDGKWIGDAIGFCHCARHEGAVNKKIAYEHKCVAKKCKYLERYDDNAWKKKDEYKNKKKR